MLELACYHRVFLPFLFHSSSLSGLLSASPPRLSSLQAPGSASLFNLKLLSTHELLVCIDDHDDHDDHDGDDDNDDHDDDEEEEEDEEEHNDSIFISLRRSALLPRYFLFFRCFFPSVDAGNSVSPSSPPSGSLPGQSSSLVPLSTTTR